MADFGWSFLPHEGDENAIFKPAESPPWSAPEYHHRGFSIEQGQKQDVFSFGMLCFWVLFHAELSAEARNSLNEKGDTNFAAQQSKHVYSLLGEWKREKKLQAVALDMVAVRFNNTRKEILTQFFKITLAHDPNERHRDFERLENLFKQLLPKR